MKATAKQCPKCATLFGRGNAFCGYDGTPLGPFAPGDPLLGRLVGQTFRLLKRIGASGFGVTYQAENEQLHTQVAVKLMHVSRRGEPEFVARFEREIAVQTQLVHPHIARILDQGVDPILGPFVATELLLGRNLAQILDGGGQLDIVQALTLIEEVLSALALLHRSGVVHRDVSAGNLFLAEDSTKPGGFSMKLMEFGLIRRVSHAALLESGVHGSSEATVQRLGCPDAMSPEVLDGTRVDERSDIFSLGAVIYELVSGQLPFHIDVAGDSWNSVRHDAPRPLASVQGRQWVPPSLDHLVLRMLAKNPDDRPPTMAAVWHELNEIRQVVETAWADEHVELQPPFKRPPPDYLVATKMQRSRTADPAHPFVLAVDDDPVSRRVAEQALQKSGVRHASCASAREALAWLQVHPFPDAVLLDIVMPGMDGLNLAATMRDHGYLGPVVFCTGANTLTLRARANHIDRSWFLDKTTVLKRLPEVLREAGVGRMVAVH